jgi:hypothetical protein
VTAALGLKVDELCEPLVGIHGIGWATAAAAAVIQPCQGHLQYGRGWDMPCPMAWAICSSSSLNAQEQCSASAAL